MKGFIRDIEELTEGNTDFRRVVYTGKHLQLVLMSLEPGEEIGEEIHKKADQFFLVQEGGGEVWIDGRMTKFKSDDAFVVRSGAKHNVINTDDTTLRLYTIYGGPQHPDGFVAATKVAATASKEHFDGETTE